MKDTERRIAADGSRGGSIGGGGRRGGAGERRGASDAADAAKLKEQLAYLAAEFENYRKRVAREREAQAAFGNEQLLRAVLPFLDNLERAMGRRGPRRRPSSPVSG